MKNWIKELQKGWKVRREVKENGYEESENDKVSEKENDWGFEEGEKEKEDEGKDKEMYWL